MVVLSPFSNILCDLHETLKPFTGAGFKHYPFWTCPPPSKTQCLCGFRRAILGQKGQFQGFRMGVEGKNLKALVS